MRRLLRWSFRLAVALLVFLLVTTVASLAYNALTADREKPASELWKGPWIEIGGVQVAYQEWGSAGTAVILIPGFGESTYVWSAVGPILAADGFHVFAMDLRGFGYTDRVGPYDLATWTEQVRQFMDASGLGTALIVGHSLGAAVAADFALQYPSRVKGIALIDGDALSSGGPPSWARSVVIEPYFTSVYRIVTGSSWIMTRILDAAYGPNHPPITPQTIAEWTGPLKVRGSEAALMQMSHASTVLPGLTTSQLSDVAVPAVVVWGSEDEMDPSTAGRETAGILHAPFHLLEGAGHLSILTVPIQVAGTISGFASSLSVPATSAGK